MKTIWHQNNPSLLEDLRVQLKSSYPSLHVYVEYETVLVRGNFPIYDKEKKNVIDEFKTEIEIPNNFPDEIPIVRETGGKIPKIADRHFYPSGNACLFMPEERYLFLPKGMTIIEFIEGPIKSFFIGQISYAETGKWIFGERPHGIPGVMDYYGKILSTTDKLTVTRFLVYLNKKRVKGHWPCYCGSGWKMRKCHFLKLLEMRELIKPTDVTLSLNTMLSGLKS